MKLPSLVIVSIFAIAFVLFTSSVPAAGAKTAAEIEKEKAAVTAQITQATAFLGAVNTALNSPKGFDVDALIKISSTFGPQFALVGAVLQIALTLYRGKTPIDNTLKNGFAEVNSRLARIEEQMSQMGDILGTELTLSTLKTKATSVGYLRRSYELYINDTSDDARMTNLFNMCKKSRDSDPGALLDLIQISVKGGSLTQFDVLKAVYDKAAYRRDVLMAWFKNVVSDYIFASFMLQVCENLQNFSPENSQKDALDAGQKFDQILKKMSEYNAQLKKEFATQGPLQTDIEREVQNAKSLGYNQQMAQRVAGFLQKKYDFAYFTVQIGLQNQGVRADKHVIYNKYVMDKVRTKIYETDQKIIIVNWVPKIVQVTLENLGQVIRDYNGFIIGDMKKAVQKSSSCSKVLTELAKTYNKNLAFLFTSAGGCCDTRPYIAGDTLTTCTIVTIECKEDEKMLTRAKEFEICLGIV